MPTTIGQHIVVLGRVSGEDDLVVAGRVEGQIEISGMLVVEDQALVKGEVNAVSVRIDGRFEGRLRAETLHLTSTALVDAELLEVGVLRIDDGAKVKAEISMDDVPSAKTTISAARPAPARTTPVAKTSAPAPRTPPKPTSSTSAAAAASPSATTTVVVEEVEEPEESGELDLDKYDDLTVKELRDRLRDLDLPVSGTKQELAERLAEAES